MGYWGEPRPRRASFPAHSDPCPPNGMGESLYCTLKARFGYWSPVFLRYVRDCYGGTIPARFLAKVALLERHRPWEQLEDMRPPGTPPTITVVDKSGRVIARWRPTAEEWEASR
jgi:hypothetical protein